MPGLSQQTSAPAAPGKSAASEIEALLSNRDALRQLLGYCFLNLGDGATHEDAEDALQDFCATSLPKVVDSYKPGPQSLTDYFKLCLKRFCWKRGKQLRRRIKETDSFVGDCELIEERQDSSPLEKLLTAAKVREREVYESRLREAISQLPSDGQRLLRLYYVEKLSIPDIATRHLKISESAVKVRLHRLRRRIALSMKVNHDRK